MDGDGQRLRETAEIWVVAAPLRSGPSVPTRSDELTSSFQQAVRGAACVSSVPIVIDGARKARGTNGADGRDKGVVRVTDPRLALDRLSTVP
jgi:hypothetical protein